MCLRSLLNELEFRSQFGHESGRVILHNIQATAACGSTKREGGQYHVATPCQPLLQCFHVLFPVLCLGQEMEYRAVMPEAEWAGWCKFCDIRLDPLHALRARAEAGPGSGE